MILTNQSIKNLTPLIYSFDEAIKIAELAGRTAYKSEKNITKDSAQIFVNGMIKNGHYAVLEHATIYLQLQYNKDDEYQQRRFESIKAFYTYNPFSYCDTDNYGNLYVTTNYRVIIENNRQHDLEFISCPREKHIKRYTYMITTNRQVQNEIVRHRSMSFLVESTRYCNYSKDKFNGQLTFIEPWWAKDPNKEEEWKETKKFFYLIEQMYNDFNMIPQEKAQILPLALKTEMVITADEYAWKHFFDLRYRGTTGTPHPQMAELAGMLYIDFMKNGFINKDNDED